MSASHATWRFTVLPDEDTLTATAAALEEHGFSVEVVDNLTEAREVVLARIPAGSSVMTNTSMTLQDTAIAEAIDKSGRYDSSRNKMRGLGLAPQEQQAKVITGQPDYALGSVHAVTKDGTLLIASATGSQLGSYAWGAANVIFIVGAQKLVPTLDAAHQRIYQHSLPLEDARAQAAYGQHSRVGKILEIHEESPGRIHVVLIRQSVGFLTGNSAGLTRRVRQQIPQQVGRALRISQRLRPERPIGHDSAQRFADVGRVLKGRGHRSILAITPLRDGAYAPGVSIKRCHQPPGRRSPR